MNEHTHWERVYREKAADNVSWFQAHAQRSLDMIQGIAAPSASVIDVGGGASTLVDDLLERGYRDVTVLDLSEAALDVARSRLGSRATLARWIAGDIRDAALPEAAYDIWHDRAVFHFLVNPADRAAYVRQAMKAVRPGGHVIVATFAPDGPDQCSGLPVMRYAPDELHGEFGSAFQLVEHANEEHRTPWGTLQRFVYCHCIVHH
jgi:2-polyprenyl-3-methyl-5-hydroxy-6-metoxy-1,4-benzoquinol methylase